MAHHNSLCDGVSDLASTAFTPMHVHDDAYIYTGRAMLVGKENLQWSPSQDVGDLKRNLLIRDLWIQGAYIIHDMHGVNTDATSYPSKLKNKCLENDEKAKKKKYLNACLKQHRNFTPFMVSVEEPLQVEAEVTLKCIASSLVLKWKESYSHTCGDVKSRISITLIMAAHRCIRGSRVKASRVSMKRPQCENGAGLQLFR